MPIRSVGIRLAIVAKRRKNATEVESMAIIGEIRGKNVLMVDDLTETRATLTNRVGLAPQERGEKYFSLRFPRNLERLGA